MKADQTTRTTQTSVSFRTMNYFSRFHIIDHKKGSLRVGFWWSKCHHVLAGVFQKEVGLVEQLHFPQAQRSEMVKVLMEFAHLKLSALLLWHKNGAFVQEHQQPMFKRVYGRLEVSSVDLLAKPIVAQFKKNFVFFVFSYFTKISFRLTCQPYASRLIHQQFVVIETEATDTSHINEVTFASYAEYVNGLVLHR